VVLTSLGELQQQEERFRPGVWACLTKPVRASRLYNCLANLRDAKRKESIPEPRTPSAKPRQFSGKILLAEDNLVNQEVAVAMLENLGCEIEVAANGQEALEASARHRFDLIFMDCQMPKMDGYTTTQIIRNQPNHNSHTPIVALTAHAMEGDRETCVAAGMDDYLSKPFTQEQIEKLLETWFLKKSSLAELEEKALNKGATLPHAHLPGTALEGKSMAEQNSPALEPNRSLNRQVLDNLRYLSQSSGTDLLGRIIRAYFAETPILLQKLHNAVQRADCREASEAAHSLKSSSANVGALPLAELFKEMEAMARADSLEQASLVLSHISREYESVSEALQKELGV
jgi:CheY-like chemotaxis protein